MSLVSLSESKIQSNSTIVDNSFFKLHLCSLNESCVKVYLYGLYIATNNLQNANNLPAFATSLRLGEQEIIDALNILDDEGLIDITSNNPLEIKFLDLKQSTARQKRIKPEKYADFSLQVQNVLKERMITPNEFNEYYIFIEETHIEPAALIMIIKYCTELRGNNVSYKYILAVAADWVNKGLDSAKSVTQEITTRERLKNDVSKILLALKLKRAIENEDNDYYIKWTKELGFDIQNILFAATYLSDKKGGMKKLDNFLLSLYKNKAFSKEAIEAYASGQDNLRDLTKKVISELGLWFDTIEPVITYYTQPWLNLGFAAESILFIASYCTKKNKRTLEEMNELIKNLVTQGLVSHQAICAHIISIAERDKKIKMLLGEAGISCNVNKWHRENYLRWSETWGLPESLITYAASISCGKSNPIPYMNAILSSWKSKGILSIEQAEKEGNNYRDNTPSSTHNYTEKELNDIIDDIDDLEI